jgi:hypothetical protein
MSSLSEKFLPLATGEDPETGIPTYYPTNAGPGGSSTTTGASYNNSYSVVSSSTTGLNISGSEEPHSSSSSASHLFCNCCCDCRRACLVLNAISIVLKIIMICIIGIGGKYISNNIQQIETDIDDDAYRKQVDQFVEEGGIQIVETVVDFFSMISIGLHLCGLYGALHFKQWGIIVAGSTYTVSLLFGILALDFGAVVMGGVFLYPHLMMYKEMKEGIMTEYNYHKIAHCCGNRNM